jgi:hypothetical protein
MLFIDTIECRLFTHQTLVCTTTTLVVCHGALQINHKFPQWFLLGWAHLGLCTTMRAQCAHLTNSIWHWTSNPKCHMTFSKTKMDFNWHLHILQKYHLNVTFLVISICKVSSFFLLHKSHHMLKPKMCVSIDLQFYHVQAFACQMSKSCKNFVKNTHCWGPVR